MLVYIFSKPSLQMYIPDHEHHTSESLQSHDYAWSCDFTLLRGPALHLVPSCIHGTDGLLCLRLEHILHCCCQPRMLNQSLDKWLSLGGHQPVEVGPLSFDDAENEMITIALYRLNSLEVCCFLLKVNWTWTQKIKRLSRVATAEGCFIHPASPPPQTPNGC